MPGYPQTGVAAINFILIGILKNRDENNRLQKNLDFFLPKGIVDLVFLQEMLEKIAPEIKFEVITPDSKCTLNEDSNKVRIFSGFRLDDEHYAQLYSARNDIGLGSGDNTLLKVVSSSELPFFQDKIDSIRNFNQYGIITLIEKMIDEQTQAKLKENLQDLKKYFKELASFVHGGPGYVGKFDVSNEGGKNSFDFVVLRKDYDKYYDYIKVVSDLAKNPGVQEAWGMVAQRIQVEFNYRDNFKGILNGAILMNNPQLRIKVENQKELNFAEFKEYVMALNRAVPSTPETSRKKALVFRLSTPPSLKIVDPPFMHETSKSKPSKPE